MVIETIKTIITIIRTIMMKSISEKEKDTIRVNIVVLAERGTILGKIVSKKEQITMTMHPLSI